MYLLIICLFFCSILLVKYIFRKCREDLPVGTNVIDLTLVKELELDLRRQGMHQQAEQLRQQLAEKCGATTEIVRPGVHLRDNADRPYLMLESEDGTTFTTSELSYHFQNKKLTFCMGITKKNEFYFYKSIFSK